MKSVKELIAYAKAKPGELNFGSAGNGTVFHLAGELLKRQAGIEIVHVPFKGGGPTVAALAGGQISAAFETMLALAPQIKAGKVRGLAVTSAQRSSVMPELPTIAELGFPGIVAENWYGFYAPAGTPRPIITRLNTEMSESAAAARCEGAFPVARHRKCWGPRRKSSAISCARSLRSGARPRRKPAHVLI